MLDAGLLIDFRSLGTEISTSQNDVRGDLLSVSGNRRMSQFQYSTQKSLSDTEINKSSQVNIAAHTHSCPNNKDNNKDVRLGTLKSALISPALPWSQFTKPV